MATFAELDALMGRVVDHLRGGDRPAWAARAAGRSGHRAGRINRIFKRGDVAFAGTRTTESALLRVRTGSAEELFPKTKERGIVD